MHARVYVSAAGRAAGIAKAPGRTSINTDLSLLVWVLSGQGVSPGKQLELAGHRQRDCPLLVRIRYVLRYLPYIFDLCLSFILFLVASYFL